ncbi:MAG TPA: endonuclease/exonuclease/phosphatase family protein [Bacteroidales bacterium]|nr:endonuclease/exonuclease/phosphatase family protein [Bacteroidales bacterium]HQO06635.1 endonuclease/exonuclease/phosphatase family protein [Bacteroidales bacterium]HQP52697.1 endonuclease/exonuclease/phosphatase family protein [Bacteroidales bacterium]
MRRIRIFRTGIKMLLLIVNICFLVMLLISYCAPIYSPDVFFFPAIIGLFYPILLIINFAFVIFWLIQLKIYFLLSLLAIIAGWNIMKKNVGINKNKYPEELQSGFKYLSYNVRLFDQFKWVKGQDYFTRDAIFKFIASESPDVLSFQEFFHGDENYFPTIGPFIKMQLTDYYHVDYSKVAGKQKHYGLATFSRFPIVNKGSIRFANSTSNSGIYTDIVINSDTIRVFNFHLESIRLSNADYNYVAEFIDPSIQSQRNSSSDIILGKFKKAFIKRAEQARIAAEYIQKSPYPVIVSGDFNDTPISYSYHLISKGLDDAFLKAGRGLGTTYAGKIPFIRIDYILNSKKLTSSNFTIHKVSYSDHYPISCIFWLNNKSD